MYLQCMRVFLHHKYKHIHRNMLKLLTHRLLKNACSLACTTIDLHFSANRNTRMMILILMHLSEVFLDKCYRSGTVNSKSFVGKVLLQIKRKFKLIYAL